MQQVLNSQQRNQAFLKFLLFFVLTTVLIISAIYFNFRVPVKENNYLQGKLDKQLKADAEQVKFVAKMDEVVMLLDSLNKTDQAEIISGKLSRLIGEMDDLKLNSGNILYNKMNNAIVSKFLDLKKNIIGVQKSKRDAELIALLKAKYIECNNKLPNPLPVELEFDQLNAQ